MGLFSHCSTRNGFGTRGTSEHLFTDFRDRGSSMKLSMCLRDGHVPGSHGAVSSDRKGHTDACPSDRRGSVTTEFLSSRLLV